jgi:hypothetical protein
VRVDEPAATQRHVVLAGLALASVLSTSLKPFLVESSSVWRWHELLLISRLSYLLMSPPEA